VKVVKLDGIYVSVQALRYFQRTSLHANKMLGGLFSADRCGPKSNLTDKPQFRINILLLLLFIFNYNWVDTRWQQYSTHLHTNSTQNTENGTYITIKRKNWELRAVPRLCDSYPGICLTTEEKARKTSVRVLEKCPDIPVATVQYTFSNKQHTEQHNQTEH
jgi:hypothetical protein